MSPEVKKRPGSRSEWERLEHAENRLWRFSLLLLLVLAVALAISSWETLKAVPQRLEALPIGIVVLMALFGLYVWGKRREIAELQGFIRGLQESAETAPSEKQVERMLDMISRSQKGFRELLDSLDQVVFTLSLDGMIRVTNRSFVDLLGLPFREVIGHAFDEFFAEPSRAEAERALAGFLEKRFWSGVLRVRLKQTGDLRYFDCRFHAVVHDGRVTAISALARDITSQHKSEARFTQLFESLQEGVYFSTPEGKMQEANPALVRMLGYASREELLQVSAQDLYFDPGQRARLVAQLERVGAVQNEEITLKRKDGSPIRMLVSATGTRDSSGRMARYQGTLVDLTPRLEMERRLHREQEFVRRLVASFPDAIVVLDTQGRYTFVSSRIQELLGYKPEELVGRALGERVDPKDQLMLTSSFQSLIKGKTSIANVEYRTQHNNGEWRIFRANASPLCDADGRIIGVVASARDVTQAKQLEEQLLQREKLAAMGQMIAGVAHELNNPLTAILGVSDLLRERSSDDATRRQTDLVHQQARRAANIVQSLLAFSRPSAPGHNRVRLGELARKAIQLHDHSLRTNQIRVELEAEPELPEIEGDLNQIIQLLMNLLVNAEQAIREVRDHGVIRVRVGLVEDQVSVAIEDDGLGIRPEILAKIFDPFFTTKRPGGGTGLGLTICLAIAKEHGGTIQVQPATGGGAVFRVLFPIAKSVDVPPAQARPSAVTQAPEAPPSLGPGSLRGHSVLVVDDEEGIRELVQEGLSSRGVMVDTVSSSEEALARLASHSYDAILCDLHLPGLSGEQLFEKLRAGAGGASSRFVYITGELLEPEQQKIFEQRGARLLQKPFHLSELVALLAELFEPAPSRTR